MGIAKILGCNEIGEKVCACAARISTTSKDALELFEAEADTDKDRNLIKKVLQSGHRSVIEHIVFNIAFHNVSVFAEQFLIEFRLASFMVKSRRYVDFGNSTYYIPQEFDGDMRERYIHHMEFLFGQYKKLIELSIPKEDARFVLPYSVGSNMYMTLNARELYHILEAMLLGRGKVYPEIRELGISLLEQANKIFPSAFSDLYRDAQNSTQEVSEPITVNVRPINTNSEIHVELLNYPQNADELLSIAADMNNLDISNFEELFKKDHKREIEQLNYTFVIDKLSFSSITHLTRHRMQSLLIPALALANENNYIIPKTICDDPSAEEIYIQVFKTNAVFIEEMTQAGISRNNLVYSLLSGTTLDVLTTMNLRELSLFMKLRACNRAQWEIREVAEKLLFKLRELSPNIFRYIGPSCFAEGKCPEGKLTCGKTLEVVEKYSCLT